jgi:hypothetical protein
MIKNLGEIKSLLATEPQGFDSLIDEDNCLCVEGIFAVAWGATKHPTLPGVFILDGRLQGIWLDPGAFAGTGLPSKVPSDLVAQVDLNPWQRSAVDCHGVTYLALS